MGKFIINSKLYSFKFSWFFELFKLVVFIFYLTKFFQFQILLVRILGFMEMEHIVLKQTVAVYSSV